MSSSSYASFAALTVLENPRKIIQKNLYLGTPEHESIVASLRYFNTKNEVFPDVGLYFVYTTVAQMDPSIEVFTGDGSGSDLTPNEFSLVGDIQFKPLPFNKRFIMAAGPITGMTSTLDNGKIKESYHVDIENVVFLGTYVAPATPAANSSVPSSSTPKTTSGNRLKRWSYDTPASNLKRHKGSDAEGDGSSSAAPSSPSPLP
ncbi:hypothetical protein B0H13DRAFT_1850963 [Mycena leptocephala]|nr:hypothetical protein B0H13DRAFT_1850963 [Mycena leptocephala]